MKTVNSIACLTCLALLHLIIGSCDGVSTEDDLTITYDQKIALDKFRELMSSRLPHDYMRKDIYLIRWLRASFFHIKEAEYRLMENLRWREDLKMDTILDEDFTEFERNFPFNFEGCDVDGRPVISAHAGDWDIRRAMITGQRRKMERFSFRLIEEAAVIIRSAQEDGKNITQFGILVNLDDFNLAQSGCPQCIPFLIAMISNYELHYPGLANHVIAVNTPRTFEALLNVIIPFFPKEMRDLLTVYGRNKPSWQSKISKYISRDQLTKEYGGIKDSALDPAPIRKSRRIPC